MRNIYLAFLSISLLLTGCSRTVWTKPGLDQSQFAQDNARCQLVAKGMNSGGFYAQGTPQFVAGAAMGNAIGTAISSNRDYKNCMIMAGYTAVKERRVQQVAATASAPTSLSDASARAARFAEYDNASLCRIASVYPVGAAWETSGPGVEAAALAHERGLTLDDCRSLNPDFQNSGNQPDAVVPEQSVASTDKKAPKGTNILQVSMREQGGVYEVPVQINGAITLNFLVDSGSADVSVPADVVFTLMRTGTIQKSDFLGTKTYILADGSTVPSSTFTIRSLKVGGKTVENIVGSVASVKSDLLLGQSFLKRFKSWSIDNAQHKLVLQ